MVLPLHKKSESISTKHKEKSVGSADHCFNKTYLLAGRDFISDSFSRPILSFNPNFRSGIPERKHFIKTFPVTSHRRTLPNSFNNMQKQSYKDNQEERNIQKSNSLPLEDIRRFTLSTISRNTCSSGNA